MPVTYTLSYEKIEFKGGELAVRGLGIPEISQLVSLNTEAAVTVFGEVQKLVAAGREIDLADLLFEILNRFQTAVAHMIAIAADEPEQMVLISKLPVDVQVAAIEKIARLSFAMDGGAKKFWGTVLALLGKSDGLKAQASQLIATFTNGSGRSGGN